MTQNIDPGVTPCSLTCPTIVKTLRWTAFLFLFAAAGHFAEAAPQNHPHVSVEALADVTAIVSGTPFQLGIYFKLEPGWYTYWKNPGDSGLAPMIDWTLPDGFTAGGIQWPLPVVEADEFMTNYAYTPDVLLPMTVTPPDDLPPGSVFTFSAKVEWLLCKSVCVGGNTKLLVSLPVLATSSHAAVNPDSLKRFDSSQFGEAKVIALFRSFQKQIPRRDPEWSVTGTLNRKSLHLTFHPPSFDHQFALDTFRLFPITPMIIMNSAKQTFSITPKGLVHMTVSLDPMGADMPDAFEGVLSWNISRETGLERRALHFVAELTAAGFDEGGLMKESGASQNGVADSEMATSSTFFVFGSAMGFLSSQPLELIDTPSTPTIGDLNRMFLSSQPLVLIDSCLPPWGQVWRTLSLASEQTERLLSELCAKHNDLNQVRQGDVS